MFVDLSGWWWHVVLMFGDLSGCSMLYRCLLTCLVGGGGMLYICLVTCQVGGGMLY